MRASKREERDRLNRLRELGQFADCTDDQLRQIDALGTEIAFDAGTVIRHAAMDFSLFVVRSGQVVTTGGETLAATPVRLLVFDPNEAALVVRALSSDGRLDDLPASTPTLLPSLAST